MFRRAGMLCVGTDQGQDRPRGVVGVISTRDGGWCESDPSSVFDVSIAVTVTVDAAARRGASNVIFAVVADAARLFASAYNGLLF